MPQIDITQRAAYIGGKTRLIWQVGMDGIAIGKRKWLTI